MLLGFKDWGGGPVLYPGPHLTAWFQSYGLPSPLKPYLGVINGLNLSLTSMDFSWAEVSWELCVNNLWESGSLTGLIYIHSVPRTLLICSFLSSVISPHLDGWDRTKDGCGLRFKVPSQCSQGRERDVDGSSKAGQVAAGQMQETCQGIPFFSLLMVFGGPDWNPDNIFPQLT